MKNLFLIVLLVSNVAHGRAAKRYEPPVVLPSPTVEPIATPSNENGNITFKCAAACTAIEVRNIALVQKAIPFEMAKPCFSEYFTSTKYRSQLVQTNGLDRAGVVASLRSGTVKDIPIIFYWPTWKQSKNVIGYTYPDQPEIYLNRSFRSGSDWSACSEISNELHEATHKLGYEHDFKATARRPYSVPYTAGAAIMHCCNESDYPTYGK